MAQFEIYNLGFSRHETTSKFIVKGEVTNKTGRDCNAVAIRVVLFNTNIPIVNTVVVVNGLAAGRTRLFEKEIEGLEYGQAIKLINRQEAYVESSY